jgi:hypothetical protein
MPDRVHGLRGLAKGRLLARRWGLAQLRFRLLRDHEPSIISVVGECVRPARGMIVNPSPTSDRLSRHRLLSLRKCFCCGARNAFFLSIVLLRTRTQCMINADNPTELQSKQYTPLRPLSNKDAQSQ